MFGCMNVNQQQAMLCYVSCIFEPMSTTASLVSHLFQYLFRLMEILGMCIQQNATVYLGMLSITHSDYHALCIIQFRPSM